VPAEALSSLGAMVSLGTPLSPSATRVLLLGSGELAEESSARATAREAAGRIRPRA
jgi:hypothetical protein